MQDTTKKLDFAASVQRLDEINTWFQQEDIDLDEGLKKLREGKDLIKMCRDRLSAVENEFIIIKQEFTDADTALDKQTPSTDTDQ